MRAPPKTEGEFLKGLVKYSIAGCLGLSLNLAFPSLPLNWLVIVLASCWTDAGKKTSILLAAVLTIFYSAYSLTPAWQIFLPLFLGLLTFDRINRNLSMEPSLGRVFLIAYLLGLEGLFLKLFQWKDVFWAVATILVGSVLLPAMIIALGWVFSRLPLLKSRIGERDFVKFQHQMGRPHRSRRPFGLEKGV